MTEDELRAGKWGDWDSCEKCKPLIEKHSPEFGGFTCGSICYEHEQLRTYLSFKSQGYGPCLIVEERPKNIDTFLEDIEKVCKAYNESIGPKGCKGGLMVHKHNNGCIESLNITWKGE